MAELDEVAGDWHKSSWSESGSCVEVHIGRDCVRVRDTKDQNGPSLTFTHREWSAFLAGVRDGEFDVPAEQVAPCPP